MIVGAAALLAGLGAALGGEPLHLSLERDAAARSCPDQAELAARVRARLDAEPFARDDDPLALTLRVQIEKDGAGLRARLRLVELDGSVRGQRELHGARDCQALAEELVLAVAITVDPLLLSRPPPAEEPARPPLDDAHPGPLLGPDLDYGTADRVAERPTRQGVVPSGSVVRLLVGVAAGVARVPAPSLRGELSLDLGAGQLDGGVRYDLPVRYPALTGDGQMDLTLVAADLAPCLPASVAPGVTLRACAAAQVGLLVAHGVDFEVNRGSTDPWLALGPRASVAWRPWPRVGLFGAGDALIPFVRPRYVDSADPTRLYHQPAFLTGSLAVGAELEIP